VLRDIVSGRFYSDQQQLDPRNPTAVPPGRFGHGSRMIGIGAAARFLESTGDPDYARIGMEFIDHILSYHVNLAPAPEVGGPFDMWEHVDRDGRPWVRDGVLASDPGHATEFVGLSLKLLGLAEVMGAVSDKLLPKCRRFRRLLPLVLERNFRNGFSPRGLGIVKSYDLVGHRAINDQLPWWSLPETMRAAIEACFVVEPGAREGFAKMAADCSNAFVTHYVRRELGLMAVQTLNPDGSVADAVPATPDADPGYHTGLSVIDCLDMLAGI
jgi:mannose/cellobiose epimerase-like protein (N-acyl-D-glucosamine 2-epimerase family)